MLRKEHLKELCQQAETQRRILDRIEVLERELDEIRSQLQDLKQDLFREIVSIR
jgi:uncharacterized protein (UPF0335 family)